MRARRFHAWLLVLAGATMGGASLSKSAPTTATAPDAWPLRGNAPDVSIMTYNVKGLPWPVALGRDAALKRIGERLAAMRRVGRQPEVVVLQEAFIPQAKALGDLGGYPYRIDGPYARPSAGADGDAAWYLGETGSAVLDSGLVVLSDLPVQAVERAAFPTGACAGYDCLAAKGVLLVTVDVPGKGPLIIAVTHLNSRKASRAPIPRTHAAYGYQVGFLAELLRKNRSNGAPMVLAGDFNRGQRQVRIATLERELGQLSGANVLREALRERMAVDARGLGRSPDAIHIRQRARDMQFVFDGSHWQLQPVGGEVPFGTEPDGSTLSDHMGFTIRYRLTPLDQATHEQSGYRHKT